MNVLHKMERCTIMSGRDHTVPYRRKRFAKYAELWTLMKEWEDKNIIRKAITLEYPLLDDVIETKRKELMQLMEGEMRLLAKGKITTKKEFVKSGREFTKCPHCGGQGAQPHAARIIKWKDEIKYIRKCSMCGKHWIPYANKTHGGNTNPLYNELLSEEQGDELWENGRTRM